MGNPDEWNAVKDKRFFVKYYHHQRQQATKGIGNNSKSPQQQRLKQHNNENYFKAFNAIDNLEKVNDHEEHTNKHIGDPIQEVNNNKNHQMVNTMAENNALKKWHNIIRPNTCNGTNKTVTTYFRRYE